MQKTRQFIKITSMIFTTSVLLLASCSKKFNEKITSVSDDKNYVIGEDFNEQAFIEEEMAYKGYDIPKGKFVESDDSEEDESVFDSCEIPDSSLFKYQLNKNADGIIITDYTGTDISKIRIPDEIEGIPVVELSGNTLSFDHNEITAIFIPDSVRVMDISLLPKELEHIHLPSSLEYINYYLFSGCEKLKKINIPANVKKIGKEAFKGSNIKHLTVPDSVTELDEAAFADMYYLKSITLSKSLTELPHETFRNCASLQNLDIPNGVTEIYEKAFQTCISLQSINIPSSVKTIGNNVFSGCYSLKELVIPEGIETLGYFSFYPESSYESNDSIEKLISIANIDASINDVSEGYIGLVRLELPDSITDLNCVFGYLKKLEYIKLPNTLKIIKGGHGGGSGIFSESGYTETKNLKCISIPLACEEIEDDAFSGLTALESLEIPESLTHIKFDGYPFKNTKLNLATQKRLRELGYEDHF